MYPNKVAKLISTLSVSISMFSPTFSETTSRYCSFSVLLQYRIYRNPFDPTLKRPVKLVLVNFIENGHKAVVQIVLGLRSIAGVFETHTEKNTGIFPV